MGQIKNVKREVHGGARREAASIRGDEIPLVVMSVHLKKFSENTSTTPEVMDSSTLIFNPKFKFSRFFFWGGGLPSPSGVC